MNFIETDILSFKIQEDFALEWMRYYYLVLPM